MKLCFLIGQSNFVCSQLGVFKPCPCSERRGWRGKSRDREVVELCGSHGGGRVGQVDSRSERHGQDSLGHGKKRGTGTLRLVKEQRFIETFEKSNGILIHSKVEVTNDGATILKAIGVDNPAAKVLVEMSKVQVSFF